MYQKSPPQDCQINTKRDLAENCVSTSIRNEVFNENSWKAMTHEHN